VCLVSPDPIGPIDERDRAWAAFREFTDRQGWVVAVLAAGDDWLPIYRGYGMRIIYAGDEAIVDSTTFRLDGGERKSLRQAVNRVERAGYTMSFHDPTEVDAPLRAELEALMHKSRRGGVERGFSMTLGRLFDPDDRNLLLAVCCGPDGHPAAFCQFAPAPSINGWSLDLMRRDPADRPNGLLDFVVVQTIRHVAATSGGAVGLNFAAMRAVLASDDDGTPFRRLQRRVLLRLSSRMQITSLWHFNAKYGPRWIPRHVAIDGTENTVPVAMAIGQAESMWELPVVGRWLARR
jgi:lysyl-tRNA synthetase class 2